MARNTHVFKNPKVGLHSITKLVVPAQNLTSRIVEGNKRVSEQYTFISKFVSESKSIFKDKKKVEFDNWNKEHQDLMFNIMYSDPRIKEILSFFCNTDVDVKKIFVPWWNEIVAEEKSFKKSRDAVELEVIPKLSYQSQLMRGNVEIRKEGGLTGKNEISICGVALTTDNKFVLGLRGGANYPNTYYYSAGSYGISEEITGVKQSVYENYLKHELVEYPINPNEVVDSILLARLQMEERGGNISYNFVVKTSLSFAQVQTRHSRYKKEYAKLVKNNTPKEEIPKELWHSGEHSEFVAVDANEAGIVRFIEENFEGIVKNDRQRKKEDAKALSQCVGPLALYANALPLLEEIAKKSEC